MKLLFLLCLFSYSFQVFSKTIIISDIDDTLKKANSVGKPLEQAYHFLKKVPYIEMRDLFTEIKSNAGAQNEEVKFFYVSAAASWEFNAQAWISKYQFPAGASYLKTKETKAPTYDFKHKTIQTILEAEKATLHAGEPLHVLMFGDNAQVDQVVYTDLTREMNLQSDIFIRDVRAEATTFDSNLPVKKLAGVNYYFSEIELFKLPSFNFVSTALLVKTQDSYLRRALIPAYTYKTLVRRLTKIYGDKDRAENDADKFWNDYHKRY
jgi:hypothetical protein